MPLFATLGLREKAIRPLAIDDLVRVLRAALVDACLARQTVAITGAQALYLSEAAPRVAQVLDRRVWIFRTPVWFRLLAEMFE
jgi:NADH dehydrogenase